MAHPEDPECLGGSLARQVEGQWSELAEMVGWSCPTCARLAAVVLPYLQILEKRVQELETGRSVVGVKPVVNQIASSERELVIRALQESGGIQSYAARRLGVSARVMHYKVRKFGLGAYCSLSKGGSGEKAPRGESDAADDSGDGT